MSLMPMNTGIQDQPNGDFVQMQDISSQRKIAEQLRQQGAQELQGQMVSGQYVAPSWTQQLARVLQSGLGGYYERNAQDQEKAYGTQKNKDFADILAGNKPQQVAGAPVTNTSMPAYEPSQQDQFGSPLPNVERTPVTTTTTPMTQETPEQQMQRVQPQVLGYMQKYGNTPEGQYLLAQLGKQDDRAYTHGEKVGDWAHQDANYARDLGDKRTDMATQNQYQTDSQGRVFTHEDKTNAGNHAFTTSERISGQGFTAGQNASNHAFQIQLMQDKDAAQEKSKQGNLQDDALTSAAETFRKTGVMPLLGSGGRADKTAIMNKAAELDKADAISGSDSAINKITGKATAGGINQLQKQRTMISAFEKTAKSNGAMALDFSNQVDRTGTPLFNQWIQAGQKAGTNNPTLASFNAANETFVTEYAKIMSGSMGNTVVSDSARAHAHGMLSTVQTKEAYAGVMATLNKEMDNRMKGLDDELQSSKDSYKTNPAPAVAPASKAVFHYDAQGNQVK